MRRREFISLIGSVAATWPLAARAQQGERVRRIGVLMNRAASDPVGQARVAAFKQGMQQLGWSEGRNIQIDVRWGEDDLDLEQKNAAQLIALTLDIIFASGTLSVSALRHLNRTVPIVFAYVADPLGAGFVDSLNQPGGNTTGFMAWEYSLSGKWVELLKEIAPNVTRVAVIRNPDNPVGIALFGAIQAEARSHRVDVSPIDSRLDAAAIELAIRNFARSPNSGVIMNPDAAAMLAGAGYKLVIALAAELKLPTIYPYPNMIAAGGLICHAIDPVDDSRRAAEYVDRILKGAKPGDLPVQATRYQIVINIKTAKTLGLTVPPALLAQADKVIE